MYFYVYSHTLHVLKQNLKSGELLLRTRWGSSLNMMYEVIMGGGTWNVAYGERDVIAWDYSI